MVGSTTSGSETEEEVKAPSPAKKANSESSSSSESKGTSTMVKKAGKGKKGATSSEDTAESPPAPPPPPKEKKKGKKKKQKAEAEQEPENETPKKRPPPSAEKENGVPNKKVKREEDDDGTTTPVTALPRKWDKYQGHLIELMIDDTTSKGLDAHEHKTKGNSYWGDICDRLNQKLDASEEQFTRDQVFEKQKRLKVKFEREEKNPPKSRKSDQQTFYELMKKLWGNSKDAIKVHSGDEEEVMNSGDEAAARPVAKRLKLSGVASDVEVGQQVQLVSDSVFGLAASLNSGMCKLVSSYCHAELPTRIRKRIVEEKLAECANLKRKLQFATELFTYHEELLEREKASLS